MVTLYGLEEEIQYYCIDLLWGNQLYRELRFVLVKLGSAYSILVCTNTSFSPEKIIRLYGYRFKIEVSFEALKQTLNGFGYHFWTKYMPKLNRYTKKDAKNPINEIDSPDVKKHILSALKVTEGFVMINCIALGLLQIVSLRFF